LKKVFLTFLFFQITIALSLTIEAKAIEPADTFIIQGIEYQSLNGSAKLDIETSGHVDYVIYELEDPYRIVIDPLDPVWCDYAESVYFNEGMVKAIRFIKGRDVKDGPGLPYYPFDFVTIELVDSYPYRLSEGDYTITLDIGKQKALQEEPEEKIDHAKIIEEKVAQELERIMAAKDAAKSEIEKTARVKEETGERLRQAKEDLVKEKKEISSIKEEVEKEKRAIGLAKDELNKKSTILKKEKAKLAKKKELLKKNEAELEKRQAQKKLKLEPRPTKEYLGMPLPADYSGKDLTLDDCINIAVSNNLSVKIAKERVRLAKMKVNEAFRELFPEGTVVWDESRGMITNQIYNGRKFGVEFKQVISHGGEQMYLWDQSKVNLKVAKENQNKAKEELVFEVSKAYYELAKGVNKRDFQNELIDDINTDFEISKKEYDFGLIPEIDFMNIESIIRQAYHTLLSYENNLSLAKLKLNKVMNISIDADIKIDSKLELKELDIDLDRCIDLALKFRPEYRVSYLNTEAARFTEKIAKSQTFPQIDIFGKYLRAVEMLEPHDLGPNLRNERVIGATVSLPFGPHTLDYQKKRGKLAPTVTTFESDTKYETDKLRLSLFDDMARSGSNLKDVAIGYKEALDELNKAEQDVHTDLRESFYSFTEAKIKIRNALSSIELYKKELEAAKIKKGLNEISFYDLIQAKQKLYSEKGTWTDTLGDYYIAVSRINKTIGLGGYFS